MCSNPLARATNMFKALSGPKHDGKHLHKILQEKLHGRRLHEAVTNTVIPTFDIKHLQPVIFSSYQLKKIPSLNAKFSYICIGTSAAPTYLPSHSFQTEDSEGKLLREFNLIDGAVAADNPGSGDMVDYHISAVFQALHSADNYLRIQDDTLSGDLATMDLATKENLENLVKFSEELLKKPVSKVNLCTGLCEPYHHTTNEMALQK
ncbi:hypothetical protein L1987_23160 [Smallanthus sonchifolius]|uniref:Uncharacterized protein n=1 Tax=Smallanthus sonchifolius TaxID=185202 RepID=A0ACB9IIC3_9ASTR|nr:hypothetical protein L1987_23160 [Smallanthus sonchifolius]